MAFFKLLRRKANFDEDKPTIEEEKTTNMNMTDPSKPDPIAQMLNSIPDGTEQASMKTYDILVLEPQEDGTTKQSAVNGVKASSPRDLMNLYAADGAKVRILKEYGGNGASQQSPTPAAPPPQMKMREFSSPDAALNRSAQPELKQASHESMKAAKQPPKFFEIGGVKCKLEDGKMFQEQWVRVDSSKYRLVADATNKVVAMNGKHLEALKWVQIEDEQGETENA